MGWTRERFEKEMHKFDRLLRLRLSNDGQWWLIERKASKGSKCLIPPSDRQLRDAFIRNRDGFIHVSTVRKDLLGYQVFLRLREYDAWQFKDGGAFADHLEAQEAKQEAQEEAGQHSKLQDLGADAYDRLRIKDGCQVGGFHHVSESSLPDSR